MRLLKRTREDDRIAANLEVHNRIMGEHIEAGKSDEDASRQALVDLQHIPMSDRIEQANEMRKWTKTVHDGHGGCKTVTCRDHAFAWSGQIPCTGTYRCVHCGKPGDDSQ